MAALPDPDRLVTLPDGRSLALDDRGDRAGTPVLYLHGTPDSRLARHPDDALSRAAGIRLLAVDRPGIGHSDPDPAATPASVAADLVHLLDVLDLDGVGILAWSAGSIPALALAGTIPTRVRALVLVAPLVPADAYGAPGVLDGAPESRRLFAGALGDLSPDELGAELAPWLLPPGLDHALARQVLDAEGGVDDVAAIPGAVDALVASLVASVVGGDGGLVREVAAQATPLGALLDRAATVAAHVHVGDRDAIAPPAMAAWLGHRLGVEPTVHVGAGHRLALTAWASLLEVAAGVDGPAPG